MLFQIIAAGLLASRIHAAPVPEAECNDQQVTTDQQFSLVAKVTKSGLDKDVNNWVLTGVHSGAGQAVQAFIQADATNTSQSIGVYYVNGTMTGTEPADQPNSDTILAAGTGSIPAGMILGPNQYPNPGNYIDQVQFGIGQPGLYIRYGGQADKKPYPHLVGMSNDDGQFYTCNLPLFNPDTPIQALYWRNQTSTTPGDCSEVDLVPQCLGSIDNSTQVQGQLQKASCYSKAASYTLPSSAK